MSDTAKDGPDLNTRVAALESMVKGLAPSPDLSSLSSRVDALEKMLTDRVSAVEQSVSALNSKAGKAQASKDDKVTVLKMQAVMDKYYANDPDIAAIGQGEA